MLRRRFVLSAASLPALLRGQEEPTFKAEVKVVNVLATVRTRKGEIIRDLPKEDFSILENGRPQTIKYFARESDLPLTLGLMVDTSMSQSKVMNAERGASSRFLEQVLHPKDQVFIMQFDMGVQLRVELTSSFRQLDEGLAFVDTPTRRELEGQMGGGTLLYDAVVQASQDIMQKQTGRKGLIILSDGVDTGSEAPLEASVEAAVRADTLIYSILFSDSGAYGPFFSPDGRGALQRMSKETGGSLFVVSKKLGLDQIFASLQEELRSQYSIGYVSDVPVRNSEFRTIQAAVKDKSLMVQARSKYWAKR